MLNLEIVSSVFALVAHGPVSGMRISMPLFVTYFRITGRSGVGLVKRNDDRFLSRGERKSFSDHTASSPPTTPPPSSLRFIHRNKLWSMGSGHGSGREAPPENSWGAGRGPDRGDAKSWQVDWQWMDQSVDLSDLGVLSRWVRER